MHVVHPFRAALRDEFEALTDTSQTPWPIAETLRIDLHCHDLNSDVPDELLGRLMRLPETWLPTKKLVDVLKDRGVDVLTITNHNNARSCWELLDRGEDILPGAEFSCTIPDYDVGVHVLTYGFTPSEEETLNRLRHNLYRFLEYCQTNDLPTVLAHPLHFHSAKGYPSLAIFDLFAVLFERFEMVNGQRDVWQNILVAEWLKQIDAEKLDDIARRTGIPRDMFCQDPLRKRLCGGSDDHMGIFAGTSGTLLRVPGLVARLRTSRRSELALEALRTGETAPYGFVANEEKLTLAFLDYFCQVSLHMKDPGLLRMMLHRGSPRDKLISFIVANVMLEMRRHRHTVRFLSALHDALTGESPNVLLTTMARGEQKPILGQLSRIAWIWKENPAELVNASHEILPQLLDEFLRTLVARATRNVKAVESAGVSQPRAWNEVLNRLEIPVHIRSLLGAEGGALSRDMTSLDVQNLLDGLPFPFLACAVLAGAAFTSTHVLYHNRPFLNRFARKLGRHEHPRRILWLTDSFRDRNGVSQALQSVLAEVQKSELSIDFLVCDSQEESRKHVVSIPPVAELAIPHYRDQVFRVPNLLSVHRIFQEGGYDRVICSTELLMGLVALFLKKSCAVPAYFYVHTDWMTFAEKTLGLDQRHRDRARRLLRAFYRNFDGLLVLNSQHREWFTGPEMGVPEERIHLTSHWIESDFHPIVRRKSEVFPGVGDDMPVLLFAGRLSDEKGVMELPGILEGVRRELPGTRLVIAGTGPAGERLRAALPEALFLGWVDRERLPEIYSTADVMVFPSRFDTFGCAVLEAMSCGLPVAAYNVMGPRDLISGGIGGFLFESANEFAPRIAGYLKDPRVSPAMRAGALERSKRFTAERIMRRLMDFVTLGPVPDQEPQARPGTPEDILFGDGSVHPTSFLTDLLQAVGSDAGPADE